MFLITHVHFIFPACTWKTTNWWCQRAKYHSVESGPCLAIDTWKTNDQWSLTCTLDWKLRFPWKFCLIIITVKYLLILNCQQVYIYIYIAQQLYMYSLYIYTIVINNFISTTTSYTGCVIFDMIWFWYLFCKEESLSTWVVTCFGTWLIL